MLGFAPLSPTYAADNDRDRQVPCSLWDVMSDQPPTKVPHRGAMMRRIPRETLGGAAQGVALQAVETVYFNVDAVACARPAFAGGKAVQRFAGFARAEIPISVSLIQCSAVPALTRGPELTQVFGIGRLRRETRGEDQYADGWFNAHWEVS